MAEQVPQQRRPRGSCEFPKGEGRYGLILAQHVETGRRFLFCFTGDGETAGRKVRERCEQMDPLGGSWKFSPACLFRDTTFLAF
ncbi:MAG TPA: hypothetical protein VEI97_11860 [bacterium]|nr:hypothetical protein [bacterium]